MTQTPNGAEAQRIVDDLEEDIVDVDKAADGEKAGAAADAEDVAAEDVTSEVPDAEEPTD